MKKILTPFELLVLIGVAACTSLATSSLMAKPSSGEKRSPGVVATTQAADGQDQPKESLVIAPLTDQAAPRQVGLLPKNHAITHLRNIDVEVDGGDVWVGGTASIRDTREHMTYFWGLQVYDTSPEKLLVSERFYGEQRFQAPPGQEITPSFSEALRLPAGEYEVKLALYSLSRQFELDDSGNDPRAKPRRSSFRTKSITVVAD